MVTDAAVVVPNSTRVVPVMSVPVIVTVVPPAVDPELGVTLVIIGADGATNVNPVYTCPMIVVPYTAVPYGVLTVTATDPAACGGVVTFTERYVTVWKDAGVVPKSTCVVAVRLVPVIVTTVPPAVKPAVGVTLVMVGGGTKPKPVDSLTVPLVIVTIRTVYTPPYVTAGVVISTTVSVCVVRAVNDAAGIVTVTSVRPVKYEKITVVTPVKCVPTT